MFDPWKNQLDFPLRKHSGRARARRRPRFAGAPAERLETRKLLSIAEVAAFATSVTPKDESIVPGEIVPGNLYVNFDGGQVPLDPVHHPTDTFPELIRPFDTEAEDNQSDRDTLIQEILYRVSEIFAPFDVQVHRIYGPGNYGQGNGDTTVFVGGDDANAKIIDQGAGLIEYEKDMASLAPPTSTDSFSPGHLIDSDPFDIAFVDPVAGFTVTPGGLLQVEHTGETAGVVDVDSIAASIAHEAGHTFGLVHVRSDGQTDPAPIYDGDGTVDDIMAYGADNVYFANQDLNITTHNGESATSGATQSYVVPGDSSPTVFQTQNSYQTLGEVLGDRRLETSDYVGSTSATVAEPDAVDPTFFTLAEIGLGVGGLPPSVLNAGETNSITTAADSLTRFGDYHVYQVKVNSAVSLAEQISVQGHDGLAPVLLVFGPHGEAVTSAGPDGSFHVELRDAGTYSLVIGAVDGNSTGSYSLELTRVFAPGAGVSEMEQQTELAEDQVNQTVSNVQSQLTGGTTILYSPGQTSFPITSPTAALLSSTGDSGVSDSSPEQVLSFTDDSLAPEPIVFSENMADSTGDPTPTTTDPTDPSSSAVPAQSDAGTSNDVTASSMTSSSADTSTSAANAAPATSLPFAQTSLPTNASIGGASAATTSSTSSLIRANEVTAHTGKKVKHPIVLAHPVHEVTTTGAPMRVEPKHAIGHKQHR